MACKFLNPNLGGEGSIFTPPPPPCWFSLNDSEAVEAVTLVFCSIQEHFIREICTKSGILNKICEWQAPVLRYWAKLRQGYFRFLDFWSIVKKLPKLQNQQ